MNKWQWNIKLLWHGIGQVHLSIAIVLTGLFLNTIFIFLPTYFERNQLVDKLVSSEHHNNIIDQPSQAMDSFYAGLANTDDAEEYLGVLFQSAKAEGLLLKNGNYKMTITKQQKLQRYTLIFPVNGQYLQIKGFLIKVMNAIPSLALSRISFTRESNNNSSIDVDIEFTLMTFIAKNDNE